jgi:hypothetical protein
MAPRRRKADVPAPWWHARPGFVATLLLSPVLWLAAVNGVIALAGKWAAMRGDIITLQRDVDRINTELRDIRPRRR